ncbi:GntR family transcriptional regulator [Solicola sp. PLA-1-18]|uniref:GntR family transcriptional regulator n=1 Tax=Solicola sp. PLA-1-18 TaxID=3380532 RepID=UPI003B7FCBDD
MTTGSARDEALERIRDLVIDGELRPGDRLVERQLADRLGVSRVPVREALQQLAHEGFAEERPTRGMVVRALDAEDTETLFAVRAALEDLVCDRIVLTADDGDLAHLAELVEQARACLDSDDRARAIALNAAFHPALVEAARSDVLGAVMGPVAGRMRWLLSQHDDPASMVTDHAAIVEALRRRDAPAARHLCRDHLASSRAALRRAGDAAEDSTAH